MKDLIIVLVIVAILVLALMASQLDIEITPQKTYVLPKIKFRFKKDSAFYSFLRPNPANEVVVEVEKNDEPYINKLMVGEAHINYGDNVASNLRYEITLKAIKDGCDEYYYYNNDPSTRFKRVSGFIDTDKRFRTLKEFDSWDGTVGSGLFFNLHRITLPIKG